MAPLFGAATSPGPAPPLLEASTLVPLIRSEVEAALQDFAAGGLRREFEALGAAVRRAVAETQAVAAAAAAAPRKAVKLVFAEGGDNVDLIGVPRGCDVGDLHVALDEWWHKHQMKLTLIGLDQGEDLKKPRPHITRQDSAGSTSAGLTSGLSATADDMPESPPSSPAEFVLPPAVNVGRFDALGVDDTHQEDVGTEVCKMLTGHISSPSSSVAPSPTLGFTSMPSTPTQMPSPFKTGMLSSGRDHRRSWVRNALKADPKIEKLGYSARGTPELSATVDEAIRAIEDGIKPLLVEDGLGGTYFMKDTHGEFIAVFKPSDEEPMAVNNPKVHAGEGQGAGLKEGVRVGEAAMSEFAAYVVDQASHQTLRAGVCPTALVRVRNSVFHSAKEGRRSAFREIKDKVGSFQLFAAHDCTSEDMGPGKFPDDQVHRLAALDIRLCNADRHSGNILVRESAGAVELIPIDHGYALPDQLGQATFEWINWPAAKRPFSEATARAILDIDTGAVETMVRRKVPELRDERILTLRMCTVLLQCGVRAGLTANDIGELMIKDEDYYGDEGPKPCAVEEMVAQATERLCGTPDAEADVGAEENSFENVLRGLFEERCQQLAQERGRTPLAR